MKYESENGRLCMLVIKNYSKKLIVLSNCNSDKLIAYNLSNKPKAIALYSKSIIAVDKTNQ